MSKNLATKFTSDSSIAARCNMVNMDNYYIKIRLPLSAQ